MCGVVGFVSRENFSLLKSDLPGSLAALAHRGPDDTGHYFDEISGIGLGHRRLSIIDLSTAGHQPMATEDHAYQIVYNGEIYNFSSIRDELIALGHQFNSATDTEVVLKAYRQWGASCLEKFVGMFAIAIWDSIKKTLFLARDRMGIKPLFYFLGHKSLIFASELKALMAFDAFPKVIDEASVSLYLHYGYVPAPKTIFQNTFKLNPGTFLLYDGHRATTETFWRVPGYSPIASHTPRSEAEVVTQLDGLLTQAVQDRLVSDVPLGALLSGGIDSSIVAALMQKVSTSAVKTFSIGFGEGGYNEAPWANRVASHLKTDHTELYVDPRQALDVIDRLPEIYDEPFGDSSAIPTFLVSQLTRNKVTVALSGDGGDELFAGYVRYWMTRSFHRRMAKLPADLRKIIAGILHHVPTARIEQLYHLLMPVLPKRLQITNVQDKVQKLQSLFLHEQLSELYRRTVCIWDKNDLNRLTTIAFPSSHFEELFHETQRWPPLNRLMHVDQHTYLPDGMLTKIDRASMANALEVRVPLIDHRVVEFAARLPEHLLLRNGDGKFLLKKLLSRYVPEKLFERPKMGFGVPIAAWIKGPLKSLFLDYLSTNRLKREGCFNPITVEQMLKEHMDGRLNHQHRLWALLIWEMWYECWM